MAGGIAFGGSRHTVPAAPNANAEWARLSAARRRRALAKTLERDIEMAERRVSPGSIAIPVDREQVKRARPLLLQILERLKDAREVSPHGVAMVRLLLTDAASPVFSPGWSTAKSTPGELESRARDAIAALDGRTGEPPAGDCARA